MSQGEKLPGKGRRCSFLLAALTLPRQRRIQQYATFQHFSRHCFKLPTSFQSAICPLPPPPHLRRTSASRRRQQLNPKGMSLTSGLHRTLHYTPKKLSRHPCVDCASVLPEIPATPAPLRQRALSLPDPFFFHSSRDDGTSVPSRCPHASLTILTLRAQLFRAVPSTAFAAASQLLADYNSAPNLFPPLAGFTGALTPCPKGLSSAVSSLQLRVAPRRRSKPAKPLPPPCERLPVSRSLSTLGQQQRCRLPTFGKRQRRPRTIPLTTVQSLVHSSPHQCLRYPLSPLQRPQHYTGSFLRILRLPLDQQH